MKILYVNGGALKTASRVNIMNALREIGHEVEEYEELMELTTLEDGEIDKLMAYISNHHVDLLISLFFILNAAYASYQIQIPYVSILWDAPYLSVYNVLAKLNHVWFTTFDKLDRERFLKYGIPHVLYQPLSVYGRAVKEWNQEIQETLQGEYIHEISFVGRLYEDNGYDAVAEQFPQAIQYYFNSIFEEAAFKWDGVNRIYGKTGQEILDYIKMLNPAIQISDNKQDVEEIRWFEVLYLIRKVANIERIAILNLLAERYRVDIYTSSNEEAEARLHHVSIRPPVIFGKAAAVVYAGSKINLNISLKGIEGGAPQRIMDIMGAGGFVMSSYCTEIADLFQEDEEIVMFRTPEELLEKVDYYLNHDEERRKIARAGCEKVINCYTYEKKFKDLLEWVEMGGN